MWFLMYVSWLVFSSSGARLKSVALLATGMASSFPVEYCSHLFEIIQWNACRNGVDLGFDAAFVTAFQAVHDCQVVGYPSVDDVDRQ